MSSANTEIPGTSTDSITNTIIVPMQVNQHQYQYQHQHQRHQRQFKHRPRQVLDVRSVDAAGVGLTAGSAANLIAVDAQRLMDTAGSLHELWGLPLQVLRRPTHVIFTGSLEPPGGIVPCCRRVWGTSF